MKKRQIVLHVVVTMLIVLMLFSTNAYATIQSELGFKLTADDNIFYPGEEFILTVGLKNLEAAQGIKSIEGYIDIDESVLEPLSVNSIVKDANGKVQIGANNSLEVYDASNISSATEKGIILNTNPVSKKGDYKLVINLENSISSDTDLVGIRFKIKDNIAAKEYQSVMTYKLFNIFSDDAGEKLELPQVSYGIKISAVPENPENPENPDNPENPENPEKPENPENPDNPENPEKPDNPSNPDNPENPEKPEEVKVKTITLNKKTLSMYVGDTETLIATITPENATDKTLTWKSSKESVATVSNGKVTAKSVGTTTITATSTDGKVVATCDVTVSKKADPKDNTTNTPTNNPTNKANGNNNGGNGSGTGSGSGTTSSTTDNTLAPTKLPKTGYRIMIIPIIAMVIAGFVFYKKYSKYNNYHE